jgi:PHP family Zn ribbon phosphoesterase
MGRMGCERYKELLEVMPELIAYYNVSLRPKGREYRYCKECRVFFNLGEGLGRCPMCGGRLRGPRKKVARYVDPTKYLDTPFPWPPWPRPRRQTTLGDFLPSLPRQAILDELWGD